MLEWVKVVSWKTLKASFLPGSTTTGTEVSPVQFREAKPVTGSTNVGQGFDQHRYSWHDSSTDIVAAMLTHQRKYVTYMPHQVQISHMPL